MLEQRTLMQIISQQPRDTSSASPDLDMQISWCWCHVWHTMWEDAWRTVNCCRWPIFEMPTAVRTCSQANALILAFGSGEFTGKNPAPCQRKYWVSYSGGNENSIPDEAIVPCFNGTCDYLFHSITLHRNESESNSQDGHPESSRSFSVSKKDL